MILQTAILTFYVAVLVTIAVIDWKHHIIPNKIVVPAIIVGFALFPFSPIGDTWGTEESYVRALAGAGTGFVAMMLFRLASKGDLGMGDVKLMAFVGAILGFPFIIGGIVMGFFVVVVLALSLQQWIGEKIPLAPGLTFGALTTLGVETWIGF